MTCFLVFCFASFLSILWLCYFGFVDMSETTSTSVIDIIIVGSNRLSRVGIVGDYPSLQINPFTLDGNNFLSWSRSCTLSISA